jgi:hypothetical protein
MSKTTDQRLSRPKLIKAGLSGIVAAIIANVLARLILGAILSLSPDFMPFTYGPILIFTTLFTLVGVVVLFVVNRVSVNPLRVYNIVAVVAFFVTLIPNLAGAANPAAMPMGGSGSDYMILIIFHVVAAIAYLFALNYVARR